MTDIYRIECRQTSLCSQVNIELCDKASMRKGVESENSMASLSIWRKYSFCCSLLTLQKYENLNLWDFEYPKIGTHLIWTLLMSGWDTSIVV